MDIEKATKIIKYKIKKYKEELEIELEDKIDEPRIAYLQQQKSALETVLSELEKKDKVINEMAKDIKSADEFLDSMGYRGEYAKFTIEEIIEEYERMEKF